MDGSVLVLLASDERYCCIPAGPRHQGRDTRVVLLEELVTWRRENGDAFTVVEFIRLLSFCFPSSDPNNSYRHPKSVKT
jgi:hypothetical protein